MKITAITNSTTEGDLPPTFPGWFEERYGRHYSQISVDVALKLKSAVKDVSRALRKKCHKCGALHLTREPITECPDCGGRTAGFVPPDIEQLAKAFLTPPQGVDDHRFAIGYAADDGWIMGAAEPGHSGTDENLIKYIERYPDDWGIVQGCLGLPRQKSRHACAYVIANRPISEFIPLTTVTGVSVTAFTAEAVEAVGGLKMDFLVIYALRDIQDCIKKVQETFGCLQTQAAIINGRRVPAHRMVPDPKQPDILFDIWDLPEDSEVFADISSGKTESVFQFSTQAAKKWLKHFNFKKPDGTTAINSIRDMAAFTALDRPGPLDVMVTDPDTGLQHNALVEYARRARGAAGSPDILPILDTLIPETYSVLTFQEQLQLIYQKMTGCTGSEAEEFRTNAAKKRKEKVDAAYLFFIEKASLQIGAEDAEKLWEFLRTWAQYGFNLSHAVSYSFIAYACAFLKHHYHLQWWWAVLKNAKRNDVNDKFWSHCSDIILLPDLKVSELDWTIHAGGYLQAPISLLHGIGEKAHQQICKYSPYVDVQDFANKIADFRDLGEMVVKIKDGKESLAYVLKRNAIQRTQVYNMLVSGVMDGLYPPGLSVTEKLEKFDEAMVLATSQKLEMHRTPEKKKTWKAAVAAAKKASKTYYATLDAVGRYQARKGILPAYGEDLRVVFRPVVNDYPTLSLVDTDSVKMRYRWKAWNSEKKQNEQKECPIVDIDLLSRLELSRSVPSGGYLCAVLGYVEEKKIFTYHKTKEALKILVDIGGTKKEFVMWPNYNTGLVSDDAKKDIQPGAICAFQLHRRDLDTDFSLKKYSVLRVALSHSEKVEKTDEEE